MAAHERPLLIVSDTHLGPETRPAVAADLAALIRQHAGFEIILAGDVFDLSFAPRLAESDKLLAAVLERTPPVGAALREHAARGDSVTIVPGNHDAALADTNISSDLWALLGVQRLAPVTVHPWFVRRDGVHIEHGHAYDPDNAPIHPLAQWTEQTEPLGIALTRRFVVPHGASIFSHAHGSTPASALLNAFRVYRYRAPGMLAHYFRIALGLCLKGGPRLRDAIESERAAGAGRLDDFAEAGGLSELELRQMIEAMPRPTHLSSRDVFFRLYFDRVFASLLLGTGLTSRARRSNTRWMAVASAAYLAASAVRGRDRYGALPETRLEVAAERIRKITQARLVVFGHTHRVKEAHGYLNVGSFAFPEGLGRPYVCIESDGHIELRRQSSPAS